MEAPSAGALRHAKTLRGRALQEARARELQLPPEERLRIAVAGSRSAEGDPGPGPGVWSIDVNGSEKEVLGNPFPMGDGGTDERRRQMVLDLHRRWLWAWDTPASEAGFTPSSGTILHFAHPVASRPLQAAPMSSQ